MKQITIEWEPKDKELTHLNYVFINKRWYMIVCYVGIIEVYNEIGTKRYFEYKSGDFDQNQEMQRTSFLCSCVGYSKDEPNEFLIVATSTG